MPAQPATRLTLPSTPKRPPRDALARNIATMRDIADLVRELRSGLDISQALLASRADVGRQWVIALEQGQPTLEAAKVLRVLEALGFELVATPYDPPPPWMLRACGAAIAKRKATAAAARVRKTTRRSLARERRLAENEPAGRVFLE